MGSGCTFTLQLLYLRAARTEGEEGGYATACLTLVEKVTCAPTRNRTPVIQPTMQSFYWLTHCGSENNLYVQEIRPSEKADSRYVLNDTGCADHCVDVAGFRDTWAENKRIRMVNWQSTHLPKHLNLAHSLVTLTYAIFSVVDHYRKQSPLHFTTSYYKKRTSNSFPCPSFFQ